MERSYNLGRTGNRAGDDRQEILTRPASFHFGPQESKLRFGEFTTFEISGQPVKTARDVSKMES